MQGNLRRPSNGLPGASAMNPSIFKACDVRGVYPNELDEDASYRIGRAIGTILGQADVVVGGDVRLSTAVLKGAVVRGLVESGCRVLDIGVVPTPAFYFAKRRLAAGGGVMVTASHNPPEFNGFKIVLGDLPITEEELVRIRSLAENGEFAAAEGELSERNVLGDYQDWLADRAAQLLAETTRAPKLVVDCGNGCYSSTAPEVFRRLSIPFVPLFCEPDGSFPNRSPNCAVADNLSALCKAVVRERADLGVAFDGDGDRVCFVDEQGAVLPADKTIAIVARHMPDGLKPGDKVVLDQKCSAAVHEVVRAAGGIPLMEKSGHTFIKTRMITEHARFGGEISGHLFYRELGGGDDGLYSAIMMTGIVGRDGPVSRLAAQVPDYATTPDIRVRCTADSAVLDAIADSFPPDKVSRLDGVRVEFEDGWALARMSVTEPVMTLRFEGRDRQALRRIMREFLARSPELRTRPEIQAFLEE